MNICGLTCISVVLDFHKRNMDLQSVRDVGDKDCSFRHEPTEHKPGLQVEAQISCSATNISLCVNSQCKIECQTESHVVGTSLVLVSEYPTSTRGV